LLFSFCKTLKKTADEPPTLTVYGMNARAGRNLFAIKWRIGAPAMVILFFRRLRPKPGQWEKQAGGGRTPRVHFPRPLQAASRPVTPAAV